VDSMTQRSLARLSAIATPVIRTFVAAMGLLVAVLVMGVVALVSGLRTGRRARLG
jgi:hypothetical protein